jgi:hypothetical protein
MSKFDEEAFEAFFENWPDCAIEGCQRKCCLALDSIFCFPHTAGNKYVKHMKIDARNANLMHRQHAKREPAI